MQKRHLFAFALARLLSNLTTHLTAPKTPMSGRRTKPSIAMARETVRIQSTCSTQMGFMMENECGAKKQGRGDKIPTKKKPCWQILSIIEWIDRSADISYSIDAISLHKTVRSIAFTYNWKHDNYKALHSISTFEHSTLHHAYQQLKWNKQLNFK